MRKLVGATNPLDAESGTLRADYGLSVTKNLIHASDSVQSAKLRCNGSLVNQQKKQSFIFIKDCFLLIVRIFRLNG